MCYDAILFRPRPIVPMPTWSAEPEAGSATFPDLAARLRDSAGALPLRTEHLILRPPASLDEDVAAVLPLAGQWEVARYTSSIPHPLKPTDARYWLERGEAERTAGSGLVLVMTEHAAPHRVVGAIGLMWQAFWPSAEVGYWVGPPMQGRGYASEAVDAVLRLAFETLEAAEVFASARPHNAPSLRVLEKAGLRPDGRTIVVEAPARGETWVHDRLAVTRSAWQALAGDERRVWGGRGRSRKRAH